MNVKKKYSHIYCLLNCLGVSSVYFGSIETLCFGIEAKQTKQTVSKQTEKTKKGKKPKKTEKNGHPRSSQVVRASKCKS